MYSAVFHCAWCNRKSMAAQSPLIDVMIHSLFVYMSLWSSMAMLDCQLNLNCLCLSSSWWKARWKAHGSTWEWNDCSCHKNCIIVTHNVGCETEEDTERGDGQKERTGEYSQVFYIKRHKETDGGKQRKRSRAPDKRTRVTLEELTILICALDLE